MPMSAGAPPGGWRAGRLRSAGWSALLAGLLVCLLVQPVGCGGGGGGGGGSVLPPSRFNCTGAVSPAPDQISLGCPSSSASPIPITVVIGGPTTSSDLYGIKFDLVFSPAVMAFLPPAIEGTFLNKGGASTTLIAATQPGDPGRLIVSITREGPIGGVQATAAQEQVMTLLFSSTGPGTTSLAFENVQAVDSTGASIASIQSGPPLSITFQ